MSSPPDIQIEAVGKTDVGLVREHNEDSFLVADVSLGIKATDGANQPLKTKLGEKGALFLVCDGMGGAAAGEVASKMAVESIFDTLSGSPNEALEGFARRLRSAVERANQKIFTQSRDNQSERGMGTTCTAAALIDQTLLVGQIGDSRCYVLREGNLAQVTKDQSLAWQLIEAGAMTAEEAKAFEHANIILQALGVQERVEVVVSQVALRRGDVVLLCSDGLHGPVADEEIADVLTGEPDLQRAADSLIQKALERDGPDNVTVVLARFTGEGLPPPSPEDTVAFVPYLGTSAYEQAVDQATPELVSSANPTAEERLVPPAKEPSGRHEAAAPAATPVATPAAPSAPLAAEPRAERQASPPPAGRSVLALFFLALVAAAAGGVVVMKCERDLGPRGTESSSTR